VRALKSAVLWFSLVLGWATPALAVDLAHEGTPTGQPVEVSDAALLQRLWHHNPEVREARGQVRVVEAELARAAALPNPSLDLGWGTLPVGETNPRQLDQPWLHVPNYTLALSQPFEPGKRGPRLRAVLANARVAAAAARALAMEKFYDLKGVVGQIAMAQLRAEAFDQLLVSSQRLLDLQRVRRGIGDVAGLDLLRAEGEHSRLVAARAALDEELADALARCSELMADRCLPYADAGQARAWVDREARLASPLRWSDEVEQRRMDFAALEAEAEAARALAAVGSAEALPGLQARVGYMYDTFTVSGNQRHSVNLGLGLTLPVWQAGQAERSAAAAHKARCDETRASRVAQGRAAVLALGQRLALCERRQAALPAVLLRAQQLVDGMTEAFKRGGTSLSESDVLLARQTLSALVLEQLDVRSDQLNAGLAARRLLGLGPSGPAAPW